MTDDSMLDGKPAYMILSLSHYWLTVFPVYMCALQTCSIKGHIHETLLIGAGGRREEGMRR